MHTVLKALHLPADAEKIILARYDALRNQEIYREICRLFTAGASMAEAEPLCVKAEQETGIYRHMVFAVALLAHYRHAWEAYRRAGISDEIFWDTASDLRCKIVECKQRYDQWGVFVYRWYDHWFGARLVRLGRLQYIQKTLKNGEQVLDVHIPSGEPLDYEKVVESYRRAFAFFPRTHGTWTAFQCQSYLLYPPYQGQVFPKGTNLYRFADDFAIFEWIHLETFTNAWRIFSMEYHGDPSVLPAKTGLQRRMIAFLEQGGGFGGAIGRFFFDGKAIYKTAALPELTENRQEVNISKQ